MEKCQWLIKQQNCSYNNSVVAGLFGGSKDFVRPSPENQDTIRRHCHLLTLSITSVVQTCSVCDSGLCKFSVIA